MTKEELYTAIETINDRGMTIANMIRDAESNYTGDELSAKLEQIKVGDVNNLIPDEYDTKEHIVTLCDMIEENG